MPDDPKRAFARQQRGDGSRLLLQTIARRPGRAAMTAEIRYDRPKSMLEQQRNERIPYRSIAAEAVQQQNRISLIAVQLDIQAPGHHTPRNLAGRLFWKAPMPSLLSSVRMRTDCPNPSSSRPVSVSTFWQVLMMCFAMPIACGALVSSLRAKAMVFGRRSAGSYTRLTSPMR